jgi:8-oxo-dGTP diphosphatase
MPHPDVPRQVTDIPWATWTPSDTATLVFVVRDGLVLLIRKKRGLGAGKINGPGGRLDPGETPLACAVREMQEELATTPLDPVERGRLSFQFVDGYGIHVHVFRAPGCEGEPQETVEATPLWTPLDSIPFGEMWADDALWLPALLAGDLFRGWFVFDGDRMLDAALEIGRLDPTAPGPSRSRSALPRPRSRPLPSAGPGDR